MKNKIQTAEELKDHYQINLGSVYLKEKVISLMIEFAKLHVKEALKQASKKASCKIKHYALEESDYIVDKDSILNSYPLENIK